MNKILALKGRLNHKKNSGTPGPAEIPKGKEVSTHDLLRLQNSLKGTLDYWKSISLDLPPLVSVYYKDIVAKSNRICGLLVDGSVVGAKYSKAQITRHIITYITSLEQIEKSIDYLDKTICIVDQVFKGKITSENLKSLNNKKNKLPINSISKSRFGKIIKDAYYIDYFGIETSSIENVDDLQIVNIYDIGIPYNELIIKLRLQDEGFRKINDSTLLLTPKQFIKLQSTAPFLISMNISDIRDLVFNNNNFKNATREPNVFIPDPKNEPVIGVIDTLFDTRAYFSKWVDYVSLLPEDEERMSDDYRHGTAVTSLIVDGPALNPALEDGCGRFKVKHFGVASSGKNTASTIMERIKNIVIANRDIKVWNLSLGSNNEISDNFISPEAEILDRLQYEYDVIFVIAGTNDRKESGTLKIGIPADSINSIVVNSVTFSGEPAKYSRKGPVLRFFEKPDISAFGGNREDYLTVYSNHGRDKMYGTSFSAPWITRKLAYLIYILRLPREVAKALIIDAAAGWKNSQQKQNLIGFGEVPKHINDIINTKDDEIKFYISGTAEDYDTYAYNIPIPQSKGKFPFVAKATLCYYPQCSRKQGVDYTDTELDIHFGRISKGKIKSIDNNEQSENYFVDLLEKNARKDFQKWNNVKHISEKIPERSSGKQVYGEGFWGISLKVKERLNEKHGKNMPFGVVITLKEINGVNRIEDFMQLCRAYHEWTVEEIDVNNSIKTYIAAEEEIEFEE